MANSAYNLESMVVAAKQAAVYTAQENSLFLSGGVIPTVQLPAGSISAQIPVLGTVTASKITAETANDAGDVSVTDVADTNVTISAEIYAARAVLRDFGAIDAAEIGRVLGNAVAKKFDEDCIAAMNGLTASADIDALDMNDILNAVATIRATGETGALKGIISPTAANELMQAIGTQAYAGGDFQTEAMRNGFVGTVAGVQLFTSAHAEHATKMGFIFAPDAARIAMFKGMDVEVQRRAEAVGNDIVASLHAGVGIVDATRGVKLVDAA